MARTALQSTDNHFIIQRVNRAMAQRLGAPQEASFSHGICPECMQRFYPEFNKTTETLK